MGRNFVAIDIGASSGRTIVGTLDSAKLNIHESHRFANNPVYEKNSLKWNLGLLLNQTLLGINKTSSECGTIDSVGIDTWGVDFGLVQHGGIVTENPTHYRDSRTNGMMEHAFSIMPKKEIFSNTGLAFMPFNTLYQLLSLKKAHTLENVERLLFTPDLISFMLTGEQGAEYTIASTSQLVNPITRDWSREIMRAFEFDKSWFPTLENPGGIRGSVRASLLNRSNARIPVALAASHDTASAVCAVPFEKGVSSAYISSGTWSLLGVSLDKPIIRDEVLDGNYTNEGGAFGKTRLLKNIMGLWILQEMRRAWQTLNIDASYANLANKAALEQPFQMFFDPDAPEFMPPGDMMERIRGVASRTRQTPPTTPYGFTRIVYENLALKYRHALIKLERIIGGKIDRLNIVGGGSYNALLNQMTANATGVPVFAGPAEATAIGNIALQAVALHELAGEDEISDMVRRSFEPTVFMPTDTAAWSDAYGKFQNTLKAMELQAI